MKYHFFGKDCLINRNWSNIEVLCDNLRDKNFAFNYNPLLVNQIHSNLVLVVDDVAKIHGKENLPKADAIVTNIKSLPICVVTADCTPILLFDKKAKICAAVHAGWRGAKQGIIKNTVDEMVKLGANNKDIEAVIGPTISQDSYEVGEEFFADFIKDDENNQIFFKKAVVEGKFLFDLPFYCQARLQECKLGLIQDQKIDTYKNEEILFSYRRSFHKQEQDCGRNVSVIMLE